MGTIAIQSRNYKYARCPQAMDVAIIRLVTKWSCDNVYKTSEGQLHIAVVMSIFTMLCMFCHIVEHGIDQFPIATFHDFSMV